MIGIKPEIETKRHWTLDKPLSIDRGCFCPAGVDKTKMELTTSSFNNLVGGGQDFKIVFLRFLSGQS
jgi:hypothetical protein